MFGVVNSLQPRCSELTTPNIFIGYLWSRLNQKTKWMVLILAGLTNAIAVAMPGMALPVLFKEISHELNLSLVQIGIIWGITALPGIITGLFGGAIVDRFGPKRVIIAAVILVGLSGALRGFSNSFEALLFTVILSGFIPPIINMSGMKNCSLWFPNRQLGLANGVLAMGMALGFLLGSFLSSTVLSPWLGGWRNVLFFYGGLAVLLSIPWLFTSEVRVSHPAAASPSTNTLVHSLGSVLKIKDIWLLGLGLSGIGACVQAVIGYLPLYLRGLGWPGISADGALSSFHLVSLIFVLPIALLSDRVRSRKRLALIMAAMTITGVGLLSVSGNPIIIWSAVVIAGMVRDGFMSVFMTMLMETDGVGSRYAGTASGMMMVFGMLGGMFASPIGNSLAAASPALPFIFWATIAFAGFFSISRTRQVRPRAAEAALS
jgi:cyanate permease